ncbi:signal peptidase II [Winogradskyella sp. 3972H.M.0a.05]|uniref:signal peptidase II n=1 Tax=Winogradskyella sp. 3972H.M.0a.05 TaxID=2950277 RepID=UPI003395BEFD
MKLSRSASIGLLIAVNIAIDQITKIIVRSKLASREVIEIFGDKFILTNVENKGAFLGIGSDLSDTLRILLLWILPIIVLGYVTYYIFRTKSLDKWSLIAFCCIIGGGIANVFDRIAFGSVTDFLHIDLGGVFKTGIFNLADVSVTTGMIILIFGNFLSRKKQPKVA